MPRKTKKQPSEFQLRKQASMRPRPDAAENQRAKDERGEGEHASMRPRPDAAENRLMDSLGLPAHASASMRPRPDAAENRREAHRQPDVGGRFNEAAARCRGKPWRP